MELLVDRYGRRHTYLRISVTDRCNLRCVYCMPPGGIAHRTRSEILSFDELARLGRLFVALGVCKIRLTGGEPLMRRNLAELVAMLAGTVGLETLSLTTNGVLLAEQAGGLKAAGLRRLNVSLDTLRPERFARIALRDFHRRVLAGIDAALEAGFAPLKLNMVVMGGVNDDEILDFVELTRERPVQVRFIETMPFRLRDEAGFVPAESMRRMIEERYGILKNAERGDGMSEGVARAFCVGGHRGTVGFISPVSEHFCAGCDRLRLTADGRLKTCLFSPPEISLRDAMRGGAEDEELIRNVRDALGKKHAAHPPLKDAGELKTENMAEIGG